MKDRGTALAGVAQRALASVEDDAAQRLAGQRHSKAPGSNHAVLERERREDTVFATLTFKNGVVGTWCFGMTLPGETLGSVVFYGSEGSLSDTSEGGPSIFHLFWRNPPGRIEAGRVVRRDGSVLALED